jgi:hypothetical protein
VSRKKLPIACYKKQLQCWPVGLLSSVSHLINGYDNSYRVWYFVWYFTLGMMFHTGYDASYRGTYIESNIIYKRLQLRSQRPLHVQGADGHPG